MTYLRQERDLSQKCIICYTLVCRPAALLDFRIHSRGNQCLRNEEVNCHVAVERELESVYSIISRLRQTAYFADELWTQNLKSTINDLRSGCPVKVCHPSTFRADAFAEPVDTTDQLSFTDSATTKRQENSPNEGRGHHNGHVVNIGENFISQSPQNLSFLSRG